MRELVIADWAGELINDRTSATIYTHAGIGSGKTFYHAIKHLNWILENKNCGLSWWLEPTHTLVKQGAIPEWEKVFNLRGWKEGKQYQIHRSMPMEIKIHHGTGTHTVTFLSADRPQYLVAATIGYLSADEAGLTKWDAIEFAQGRLRSKDANYVQATIFGAPQGMNAFADHANFKGTKTHELDGQRLIETSHEVSTYTNEDNLAPGYIARQLLQFGHNKAKVDAWIYGKFTSFFEGIAHPEYDPERDRHSLDPEPHTPLAICWDWNVQPLAWVAVQKRWVKTPYGDELKYCTVGESSGEQRQITDACVEFIARYDPKMYGNTQILIDGDATGQARSIRAKGNNFDEVKRILSQFYKNVRIIVGKANPLVSQRVEVINRAFSYSKFLIHTNDKKTSDSFLKMKWAEGGKYELAKPQAEEFTHFGEAVSYHVYRKLKDEDLRFIKAPGVIG